VHNSSYVELYIKAECCHRRKPDDMQFSIHSSQTLCKTACPKPDGRQARMWPAVVAAKRY
jgi:hypothetical protein